MTTRSRFPRERRLGKALRRKFQGSYGSVLLFDGNMTLTGDFVRALDKLARDVDLIAVDGNLTVDGPIALYARNPGLLVTGITRAESLEGGDAEMAPTA